MPFGSDPNYQYTPTPAPVGPRAIPINPGFRLEDMLNTPGSLGARGAKGVSRVVSQAGGPQSLSAMLRQLGTSYARPQSVNDVVIRGLTDTMGLTLGNAVKNTLGSVPVPSIPLPSFGGGSGGGPGRANVSRTPSSRPTAKPKSRPASSAAASAPSYSTPSYGVK